MPSPAGKRKPGMFTAPGVMKPVFDAMLGRIGWDRRVSW
jgi:hypothetical protein